MARHKRSISSAVWILTLFGISLPLRAPGLFAPYKDGAPVGFTGGFGEKTCRACHFDQELNHSGGWLEVAGLPGEYAPDSAYSLLIAVSRPNLGRAGFSLSARYADSTSAGLLVPADSAVRLTYNADRMPFATHTEKGNQFAGDSASWHLLWRSPPVDSGRVIFNVAANAANGDDSEFGDWIYVFEHASDPAVDSTGGN